MRAAFQRSVQYRLDTAEDVPLGAIASSAPAERSGFATRRQPNWAMIAAILLAHAVLIVALVKLDIVSIQRAPAKPTVVTLLPEDIAPPPPPPPPPAEATIVPLKPVAAPIVAPPPVVAVATPAAPPVATVAAPPPPQATVAAAPAEPPGPPAPITPPDASAASLRNPSPRYPVESRMRREEGTVRLRVVITEEGRVKEIAVAKTSGFDRLDKAALEAVRRWKFMPGMQAGRAVEAVGFLNIPFKLSS